MKVYSLLALDALCGFHSSFVEVFNLFGLDAFAIL